MNTTLQRAENVRHKLAMLLERHEALLAENTAMQSALEEVIRNRESLLKENEDLREELRQARIASGLKGSENGSSAETKATIAELVREIDKCIALLNA